MGSPNDACYSFAPHKCYFMEKSYQINLVDPASAFRLVLLLICNLKSSTTKRVAFFRSG